MSVEYGRPGSLVSGFVVEAWPLRRQMFLEADAVSTPDVFETSPHRGKVFLAPEVCVLPCEINRQRVEW